MIITRQTTRERELLNIAAQILNSFKYKEAGLGGGLLLSYCEIPKLREANDIDIILSHKYARKFKWDIEEKTNDLCHKISRSGITNIKLKENKLSNIFFDIEPEYNSYDSVISFIIEGDIKVDFLRSKSDEFFIRNNINCSSIEDLIESKFSYIRNNIKHAKDLCYMYEHNVILSRQIISDYRYYSSKSAIKKKEKNE